VQIFAIGAYAKNPAPKAPTGGAMPGLSIVTNPADVFVRRSVAERRSTAECVRTM
jgi:hypothetical protein